MWATTAAIDVAMLALHAQLLAGTSGHHHVGAHPAPLMWLGIALVTAQLVLAGTAALRR